jgi:hypothetical protein
MPTNMVLCLETIKEISNLSIVPKGVTEWLLKYLGGGSTNEPKGQIASMLIIAGVGIAALGLIVGLYFMVKYIPAVNKVYVSIRDKLVWGVFLTFIIKSYLKMYTNSIQGVE